MDNTTQMNAIDALANACVAMNQARNEGMRRLGDVAGNDNQGDTCLPENELNLLNDAMDVAQVVFDANKALEERQIHALVKEEGSTWAVRLYDQHGLELPMFVYASRYQEQAHYCGARSNAWAVAEFINGLCPSARAAMYEAQR